jgi:hypothetical protein
MKISVDNFYLDENFTIGFKEEYKERIINVMKDLDSSENNPIHITIYADETWCFDNIMFKEHKQINNDTYYNSDLGFFEKTTLIRQIVKGSNFKYDVEFENTDGLLSIIKYLSQYAENRLNEEKFNKKDSVIKK